MAALLFSFFQKNKGRCSAYFVCAPQVGLAPAYDLNGITLLLKCRDRSI
jgi:hypothetical protein